MTTGNFTCAALARSETGVTANPACAHLEKHRSTPVNHEIPIVYLGNDWFAENRTSSHHIARRLGKVFPVLYVDCPGFRAPKANSRDFNKLWRKLRKVFHAPRQIDEHMWQITMPQIPLRNLPFVGLLNRWFGCWIILRALHKLGLERPILWFLVPHTADLLGHLNERFSVYYCTDDHSSMPGVNSREIRRMDELLTRRSGQVFVTSPALLERKLKANPSTTYSPHGVDVAMFQKALDPDLPLADGVRNLPHPIIGFYGLIEAWVDLDLIEYLATARPNWTFVMIGRVAVNIARFKQFSNVLFPGTQPYESLPAWAKAFDVSIIPFRQSELVRNVNPLKLREYLAAGSPVVSVPMAEVNNFSSHVWIARTREDFLTAIEEAFSSDNEERRAARKQLVAAMTWDARVEEVVNLVWARMEESGGQGRGPLA